MAYPPPFPNDGHWRPVPTNGAGRDDFLLSVDVIDRLSRHPATDGTRIAVDVRNRVVILEGTVPSSQTRVAAGDVAWRTPGVFDVANLLRVEPR